MSLHSLSFDNKKYTPKKAQAWMRKHNYRPIKPVHKTVSYNKYRITQPKSGARYRTVPFGADIQAVFVYPKGRKSRRKKIK